eukprot:GHVL01040589.1.p1 GENE.GHVL01040589.1~~GHVL01040589.1.p1  ORF type:complete len:109 (+),score=14.98 GHVL01040589.1:828-1154(+)
MDARGEKLKKLEIMYVANFFSVSYEFLSVSFLTYTSLDCLLSLSLSVALSLSLSLSHSLSLTLSVSLSLPLSVSLTRIAFYSTLPTTCEEDMLDTTVISGHAMQRKRK